MPKKDEMLINGLSLLNRVLLSFCQRFVIPNDVAFSIIRSYLAQFQRIICIYFEEVTTNPLFKARYGRLFEQFKEKNARS
jgi:hypothetical protein